jgi:hypothetical protein
MEKYTMLKKILLLSMAVLIAFTLTACRDNSGNEDESGNNNGNAMPSTSANKPFSESDGLIRYLTIDDIQVAIPETVGEYARYLEKVGTKVELIANPTRPDTAVSLNDTLEANNQSSVNAYFKVYMEGDKFHRFGVHYVNDTNKDIAIADAEIAKIILYNDTYAEQFQDELTLIDTIVCVTDFGNIAIDGRTRSSHIMNLIGGPNQNTEGYWTYNHESGFVYRFATSNQPGTLTQVDITYPK